MTFADAVASLESRSNYERSGRLTSPTLERIASLMGTLADPQRSYPVVHVTGTVGKSSAAHAASEVLRSAGLAVGTYTSPHVDTIRERFSYDGRPITEDEFTTAWDELAPYLRLEDERGSHPVTWFEATTALAYVWFAEKAVDVAVVEVGMGGSWDATNVTDGTVAVFTPIALDHTSVLGSDAATIAAEKAGIIKRDAVVVTAAQDQDVADVIRGRSADLGAQIRAEGMAFALERSALALGGQQVSFRLDHRRYQDLFLPVFGEHSARDAILGIAAARAFLGDPDLDVEVVAEALSRCTLPGRLEVAGRHPLVVLDGAHNPAGAEALCAAMRGSVRWGRLVAVVSVMDDKDVEAVVAPIAALADEVIATRNTSPRAADPGRVAEAVRTAGGTVRIASNVADAVTEAILTAGEQDCILVTGSLYTVADARPSVGVSGSADAPRHRSPRP